MKEIVKRMLSKDQNVRPTAQELLSFFPNEIELELKWEKAENQMLQTKLGKLKDELKLKSTRRRSIR